MSSLVKQTELSSFYSFICSRAQCQLTVYRNMLFFKCLVVFETLFFVTLMLLGRRQEHHQVVEGERPSGERQLFQTQLSFLLEVRTDQISQLSSKYTCLVLKCDLEKKE